MPRPPMMRPPVDRTRDPAKAVAYQKLYAIQQEYDTHCIFYNIYSGKSNPSQVDEATAKVMLAKAKLAEARLSWLP